MTDTEFNLILLGVVALIIVAGMFLFRRKFSLHLKIFGAKLDMSGENKSSPEASSKVVTDATADGADPQPSTTAGSGSKSAVATGDRAVAIEGGAGGATIVTGDNSTVSSGEQQKEKP